MNTAFMNSVFKLYLSMSLSGSLLIVVLWGLKGLLKNKVSRQWQYYIWLVVIMRLLLPFGPEKNLLGNVYQKLDLSITRSTFLSQSLTPELSQNPEQSPIPEIGMDGFHASTVDIPSTMDNTSFMAPSSLTTSDPFYDKPDQRTEVLTDRPPLLDRISMTIFTALRHLWLLWIAAALGMAIRKITIYQSFHTYIRANSTPVSNIETLDLLSVTAERLGIKRPVELWINPLIASPMLIGLFYPRIVLPSTDIPEEDLPYILLHELTHCKRRDLLYKWLVQSAVCLHWFNPLVYLMSWEIAKDCEFSCDEAVLGKAGYEHAGHYGKTLLDAMRLAGKYKESLGSVTLNENKKLLKERLCFIMSFKKRSKASHMLTAALTMLLALGASFTGVYPISAKTPSPSVQPDRLAVSDSVDSFSTQVEDFYKSGSLPLFQIGFSRLDQAAQNTWLERIYADKNIAFFSVCLEQLNTELNTDNPLIQQFAEKAYADGQPSFFSVAADSMNQEALEKWLQKALEDGQFAFQSILFGKLNMDKELDSMEQELERKQLEEYREVGITREGKTYYYEGQPVNIFLDMRQNRSFYTLEINPQGTVNVKITRNEDGRILQVDYMTQEEVTQLLGDMEDLDD